MGFFSVSISMFIVISAMYQNSRYLIFDADDTLISLHLFRAPGLWASKTLEMIKQKAIWAVVGIPALDFRDFCFEPEPLTSTPSLEILLNSTWFLNICKYFILQFHVYT